jgi:hypothetical protein
MVHPAPSARHIFGKNDRIASSSSIRGREGYRARPRPPSEEVPSSAGALLAVDLGLRLTASPTAKMLRPPNDDEENPMDDTARLAQQIHELKGSMLAMECFVNSLTEALSSDARLVVQAFYASEASAYRAALMGSTAPEATVGAFERDVDRALRLLGEPRGSGDAG